MCVYVCMHLQKEDFTRTRRVHCNWKPDDKTELTLVFDENVTRERAVQRDSVIRRT